MIGVRQEQSLAEFFADADPTGAVRAERAKWLAEDPDKYAALLPEAESALRETVKVAKSLGHVFNPGKVGIEQLIELSECWEPDFVWMHPDSQGVYRCVGGAICFPSAWALRDKLGRPMQEVHEPVPGLNSALGRSIDTFLAKQVPGVVWQRENWSLARDDALNHHPSRQFRLLDATITADEVWFRLEHQLLMKLPETGSVLFGIRMELVPLQHVIENDQAAARFVRALESMAPAAAEYKNISTALPRLVSLMLRQD